MGAAQPPGADLDDDYRTPAGGPPYGSAAPDRILTEEEVEAFIAEQLAGIDADGRSVCVLVPDATRACPLPLLVGAVHRALHGRVPG